MRVNISIAFKLMLSHSRAATSRDGGGASVVVSTREKREQQFHRRREKREKIKYFGDTARACYDKRPLPARKREIKISGKLKFVLKLTIATTANVAHS